jgi:hypothetical protein
VHGPKTRLAFATPPLKTLPFSSPARSTGSKSSGATPATINISRRWPIERREHGIPFDEAIARADAAKAFTDADLDRVVKYSWIIEPGVDDAYRLIAADAAGVGELVEPRAKRLILRPAQAERCKRPVTMSAHKTGSR